MASVNDAGSSRYKKKLQDLLVKELKSELDRRGLDKAGVKTVLVQRLQQALEDDGVDADDHLFEVAAAVSPVSRPGPLSSKKSARILLAKEEDEEEEAEVENTEEQEEDEPMEALAIVEDAINLTVEEDDKLLNEDDLNELDAMKDALEKQELAAQVSTDAETKPVEEEEDEEEEEEEAAEEKTKAEKEQEEEMVEEEDITTTADGDADAEAAVAVEDALSDKQDDNKPEGNEDGSLDVHVTESDELDTDLLTTEVEKTEEVAEEKPAAEQKEEGEADEQPKQAEDSSDAGQKEECPSDQPASVAEAAEEKKDDKGVKEAAKSEAAQKGKSTPSTDTKPVAAKETKPVGKDQKDHKHSVASSSLSSGRNLWVSGLSSSTRATDLKAVFSKHGKVIGAKVVTSARTPGARCYGFVTMATHEEATKCIQHLHRTELHGRMISVERAKNDPAPPGKKAVLGKTISTIHVKKPVDKKDVAVEKKGSEVKNVEVKKENDNNKKTPEKRDEKKQVKIEKKDVKIEPGTEDKNKDSSKSENDKTSGEEKDKNPEDVNKSAEEKEAERKAREERDRRKVLTLKKIQEQRQRERERDRERMQRQRERCAEFEAEKERRRLLDIERRNREEARRLHEERDRLRFERERLEREKAEAERLERERIRLERERRERERLERESQREADQRRMDNFRRQGPYKPMNGSRPFDSSPVGGRFDDQRRPTKSSFDTRHSDISIDDRKRSHGAHVDQRFGGGPEGNRFHDLNRDRDRGGPGSNTIDRRVVERYERRDVKPSDGRFEARRAEREGNQREVIRPPREAPTGDRDDRRVDRRSGSDRFERSKDSDTRHQRDRINDRPSDRPSDREKRTVSRPGPHRSSADKRVVSAPSRDGPPPGKVSRREDTGRSSSDRRRESERSDRPRGPSDRGDREDSRREWKSERAHMQGDRRSERSGPGPSRSNFDSRYESRNQTQFSDNRNKSYGGGPEGGGGPVMSSGPTQGRDQFNNSQGPSPQGGRWPDRGPAPMAVNQPQMMGPPAGNIYINPQGGPPGIVTPMGGFISNIAPVFTDTRGRGPDIYDAYKNLNTGRRF
ncbi:PREDICTED: scaffold attachment factor B2-like isoform X4 [Priapulus caudatus]|uniref:Scaffold attachment factor B2-like isoform X3 n=1 Tax=Priapulus caudatus TaxID=37621 RepID=A0ABM1DWG8_PRICU|nr:PREDICTED: scaffold attachment factor B2-like isoform X3 [Priapulus caudatus]XP_014664290.1 PREDICTED: scaffold attachment factor B2-like isoform X4 [Priapulus caudatus]